MNGVLSKRFSLQIFARMGVNANEIRNLQLFSVSVHTKGFRGERANVLWLQNTLTDSKLLWSSKLLWNAVKLRTCVSQRSRRLGNLWGHLYIPSSIWCRETSRFFGSSLSSTVSIRHLNRSGETNDLFEFHSKDGLPIGGQIFAASPCLPI